MAAVIALLGHAIPPAEAQGPLQEQGRQWVVQNAHAAPLGKVVFSPDGAVFATTAPYRNGVLHEVCVWETASGDKQWTVRVGLPLHGPAFCLDGRALIAGGAVWDTRTGERRHALPPFTRYRITQDGKRAILASENDARVIDLESGTTIASLAGASLEWTKSGPARRATSDASATEGKPVIAAVGFTATSEPLVLLHDGGNEHFAVWNMAERTGRPVLTAPTNYSYGYAEFSPNGDHVVFRWDEVSDSWENAAVFDTHNGKELASWHGSVVSWEELAPVLFTPDGKGMIARTQVNRLTLFDLASGEATGHLDGHESPIVSMRLIDGGRGVESQSRDAAQRWDLATGAVLRRFENPLELSEREARRVRPVVFPSPDGKRLLCGDTLLDAESGQLLRRFQPLLQRGDHVSARRALFSPDGKRAIVAWRGRSNWGQAGLYDVEGGELLRRLAMCPSDRFCGIQWNRDGSRALTSRGSTFWLWDADRGKLLVEVSPLGGYNQRLSFSPNGRLLYTDGSHVGVFFWDAETGEPLGHEPPAPLEGDLPGEQQQRHRREFYRGRSLLSPDGVMLASLRTTLKHGANEVLLWDVNRGEMLRKLGHGKLEPHSMRFSPNGNHLSVVCSAGHHRLAVVVWDTRSGERLYRFDYEQPPHRNPWPSVRFIGDGERFLLNSGATELALCVTATGQVLRRMAPDPPLRASNQTAHLRRAVLLSPNATKVLASYASKYVIAWDLKTGDRLLTIKRDLGGVNVDEYFSFSKDGDRLLTRCNPATIWDLETGASSLVAERERRKGVPGFGEFKPRLPSSRKGNPIPAAPEVLEPFADRISETAHTTEQTANGKRLIVYHDDNRMEVWEIASDRRLHTCYLFGLGEEWLTLTPGGEARGSVQHVRDRPDEARLK